MRCAEFESRWQELLDERQDPASDTALAAHASHCAACADLLTGQRAWAAGLSRGVPCPARGALAPRVVAAAALSLPVLPARRAVRLSGRQIAGLLSAAAVMMMTVSIAWYLRSLPAGAGPAGAGSSGGGRAAVARRSAKARRLIGIIRPGVGARLTTDVRPGGRSAEVAPLPPSPAAATSLADYELAIDELASAIPLAAQQLDEVERIAPGIRPLRLSLAVIWETVCRAISGLRTDASDQPHVPAAFRVWPREVVELA